MAFETDLPRFENAVLFANGVAGTAGFDPDRRLAGMPGSKTLLVFFNNADAFYAKPEAFTRWRRRVCVHRFNGGTRQYFGWNRGDISKVVFSLPPLFLILCEKGAKDGFYGDPVTDKASFTAPREERLSATLGASVAMAPDTRCGPTTGFATAMALRKLLKGEIVLVGFKGVQPWSRDSHDEDGEHAILSRGRFTFMDY